MKEVWKIHISYHKFGERFVFQFLQKLGRIYKKQSKSVSFNSQTPRSWLKKKKIGRASFFPAAHSQCLSVLDILHLRLIWWGVKEPSGILKLTAEHNKRQSDPFHNIRRENGWMRKFIQECSTFCPWAEVSLRGFIVRSPLILSLVSSRPWWMGKYNNNNNKVFIHQEIKIHIFCYK